jgi:flavodoxin
MMKRSGKTMKKRIKTVYAGILILTMLLGLAGCGAVGGKQAETTGQSVSAEPSESAEQDVLVVYFSRTGEQYGVGEINKGNTAIVADMIIDQTGADSFEILPEEDYYPYTYDELTDVAKQEQNENARPAYAGEVPDLTQYSTVFIGAPVWWSDWPMIMYTFFENEDLSGKTLIPFSTHEGSGLAGFDRKLSDTISDAEVLKGFSVRGYDAQNKQDSVREEVKDWLASLAY